MGERDAGPGRWPSALIAALCSVTSACFAPTPTAGLPCGAGDACPEPLVCRASTQTCEPAAAADANPVDAPLDAGADARTCADADEDGDGVCDDVDVCPHVADPEQRDVGEIDAGGVADGVGDACDPRPTEADMLLLFEPFNAPLSASWACSDENVEVVGGQLILRDAGSAVGVRCWVGPTITAGRVDTKATVLARGSDVQATGVVTMFEPAAGFYECLIQDDASVSADTKIVVREFGVGFTTLASTPVAGDLAVGQSTTFALTRRLASLACAVPGVGVIGASDATLTTGFAAVVASDLDVAFDYVAIYVDAD